MSVSSISGLQRSSASTSVLISESDFMSVPPQPGSASHRSVSLTPGRIQVNKNIYIYGPVRPSSTHEYGLVDAVIAITVRHASRTDIRWRHRYGNRILLFVGPGWLQAPGRLRALPGL